MKIELTTLSPVPFVTTEPNLVTPTPAVTTSLPTAQALDVQNTKHILETEILANLLNNRAYFSDTIYHLDKSHFTEMGTSLVFEGIKNHYLDFQKTPSIKELLLSFKDQNKKVKENVKPIFQEIQSSKPIDSSMLLDLTEKFIKMSMFGDAIMKGADALSSKNEDLMTESFALAEDAVKVTLQSDLGVQLHEIDKIFDEFKEKPGIKLGIPSFDQMIGDGFTPKTLHSVMAASGVGKTAAMIAFAVQFLLQKKDVVIVSLEMSEAEMYRRLYANIYDIDIGTLGIIDKQIIKNKHKDVKDSIGSLVVKEFPTGGLTPLGLDSYLAKLANETGIEKPIVIVDYLGLMSSDRMKNADNSYSYFGSIAEELRAIAQKRDLVMFTPLQLNRSAINNLETDQSALSESMKILMVLDSAFIIAQTPQMKENGKMKINYVKNRMSGKTWSFDIGFCYRKFRFIDTYNMGGSNVTATETNDVAESLKGLMSF